MYCRLKNFIWEKAVVFKSMFCKKAMRQFIVHIMQCDTSILYLLIMHFTTDGTFGTWRISFNLTHKIS